MNIQIANLIKELNKNPVIPCISNFDELLESAYADIKTVLIYDTNIFDLINITKKNLNQKKTIILNIDTVKGLCADEYGIKFLRNYIKIDIIATASPKIINCLKKLNCPVMQLMFILDTKSLKKGIELVTAGKPDLIDIRPGILFPKAAEMLRKNFNIPTICSGFINNQEELKKILDSGAVGITTSSQKLWTLYL